MTADYRPQPVRYRKNRYNRWDKPDKDDMLVVTYKYYGDTGVIEPRTWFYQRRIMKRYSIDEGVLIIEKVDGTMVIQPLSEIIKIQHDTPSAEYYRVRDEWAQQEYGLNYDAYTELSNVSTQMQGEDAIRKAMGVPDNYHVHIDKDRGVIMMHNPDETDEDN